MPDGRRHARFSATVDHHRLARHGSPDAVTRVAARKTASSLPRNVVNASLSSSRSPLEERVSSARDLLERVEEGHAEAHAQARASRGAARRRRVAAAEERRAETEASARVGEERVVRERVVTPERLAEHLERVVVGRESAPEPELGAERSRAARPSGAEPSAGS